MTLWNYDLKWNKLLFSNKNLIFDESDINKKSLNWFFEKVNDFLSNILILSKKLNKNKSRISEIKEKKKVQFQEYHDKFKDNKY